MTLKDAVPGNDGLRHEVRPDGRWTVRTGPFVNPMGTWRIEGDRLCPSLRRSEDCATVYRIDAGRLCVWFEGWSLAHSTLRAERRPG